jgi:hypothetical protein
VEDNEVETELQKVEEVKGEEEDSIGNKSSWGLQ